MSDERKRPEFFVPRVPKVQAIQFTNSSDVLDIVKWVGGKSFTLNTDEGTVEVFVSNARGTLKFRRYDWVVGDEFGNLFVRDNDEFYDKYQPKDSSA